MTIRLDKPWIDLADLPHEELPAQLGVFELGDASEAVVFIGYAGGNRAFGLRTAIVDELERLGPDIRFVRWELTQGYLSRWEELMMVHHFDHGAPPPSNNPATVPRGRLTPGSP